MLAVIFLCCLHLVVLEARPPPPGLRTEAEFRPPTGIRHSRSSGSESAVKKPNRVPALLLFSKNSEGVPQLSITDKRDSLGKPTRQPDTVVKQNKLQNLHGLTMEQIKQKYGPGKEKPLPKSRNPPAGMDIDQVSPCLARSTAGNRVAKVK
ncbi:uncharacterized protein [Haliotis asinina]|uniref:uncharacterized protein n=1 Tax=Haliotis asinina TaxID=109174 RepID=UPI0035327F37